MVETEERPKGISQIKQEYLVINSEAENTCQTVPVPISKKRKNEACKESFKICFNFAAGLECSQGSECKNSHDIEAYLAQKEPDISGECFLYTTFGKCNYGYRCRFAGSHLDVEKRLTYSMDGKIQDNTINQVTRDLQTKLRKRKYKFEKSQAVLREIASYKNEKSLSHKEKIVESQVNQDKEKGNIAIENHEATKPQENVSTAVSKNSKTEDDQYDRFDDLYLRLRPDEKKKVDFREKLILAPLTTVGNLPFRRICKEFGADITIGEMALTANILQGNMSEWALLKRHTSEDVFGVQICGRRPDSLANCAEIIERECQVDFVDINMGCPIDLIYNDGMGSAMLSRISRLPEALYATNKVLDCPLTVKMRTGVVTGKNIAHKAIPMFAKYGISAVTVHGRSREQRYLKTADWDYIKECVDAAENKIPVVGNGDILSFTEYNEKKSLTGVSSVMLARGALIKPWLFTEIKEQRHIDISSTERLEIIKKYANYGLEYFGSDTRGVERTRTFLLEWLSFLHRYVPVGLLEVVPQLMNDRPPKFKGRNELETLMASNNPKDWVSITEMLLGKVSDDFHFEPKHKAKSFA